MRIALALILIISFLCSIDAQDRSEAQAARVRTLFESGQEAHAAGKLDEAIKLYSQALELDPELWQAELQRGAAYLSQSKYTEAGVSAEKVLAALKEFSDSPALRSAASRAEMIRAEVYIATQRNDEAEAVFKHVLELIPNHKGASLGIARLMIASGKFTEAAQAAAAAIAAGDTSAQAYLILGSAQLRAGNPDEALANLTRAVEKDPRDPQALGDRADIFIARKDLPRAAVDLRALCVVSHTPDNLYRLAQVLRADRKYDETIKVLDEVLSIDPSNLEASTARAELLIETGQSRNAREQLEILIKANPRRADLHGQLATLMVVAEPEAGMREYRTALELDPRNASYSIGLAFALVKQRRFDEAIQIIKALPLASLSPSQQYTARANLATALFELKDFPTAAQEYIWMLKYLANAGDRKKTAVTSFFLGVCFDRIGDFEQALKAYQQFLTLASADQQLEIEKVKLRLPPLRRQLESQPKKKK